MAIMKRPALALALAGVVSAQSASVVNVFFPGADEQTLLGSIIASDATKTTMAVACPSDANSSECDFVTPVTVTVGPSTFHAEEAFETLSVVLDCNLSGTTAATCSETYIGPAGLLATDSDSATATDDTTDTQITTTATTTVLSQSEIVFLPVTLTSMEDASNTGSATGSASTSGATLTGGSETQSADSSSGASSTRSSETSSGASSASGSAAATSASGNNAAGGMSRTLGWTAAGACMALLTFLSL